MSNEKERIHTSWIDEQVESIPQQVLAFIPEDVTKRIVHSFFLKMNLSSIDYPFKDFRLDKAIFISKEWGGIVVLSGNENGRQHQLFVFISQIDRPRFLGYGSYITQDNQGRLAFKIFKDERAARIKSRTVFMDYVQAAMMTSGTITPDLLVPTTQQYNPIIEGVETAAPIMYRKLGFSSSDDPENLIEAIRGGEQLNNQDLQELSKHPLHLALSEKTRTKVLATREKIHPSPLSDKQLQLLEQVALSSRVSPVDRNTIASLLTKLWQK